MGWDVHEGDGLAHYARACTDITFRFPFGVQELMGIAARGNFDLTQHTEGSGKCKLHIVFFIEFFINKGMYVCIRLTYSFLFYLVICSS